MLSRLRSLIQQSRDTVKINRQPAEPWLELPHDDAEWLIRQWLVDCNDRLADVTVRGYREKIEYFRLWWLTDGRRYNWQLSRRSLRDFEKHLRTIDSVRTGDTLSYHTRDDAIRRLSAMLRWSFDHNYTPVNCADWITSAQGAPPRREAADVRTLQLLLESADQSPAPTRDRAVLAFFIGTGARLGECTNLNIEDISMNADGSGIATVFGKRTRANRSGERQVAFDALCGHYLANHIDTLGMATGAMWRSLRGGHRLTKQGVYKIVKRAIAIADVGDQIRACHDLRRAFATHWARLLIGDTLTMSDAMSDLLRRQLGHQRYSMVAEYTLLNANDIRQNIQSPLALMDLDKDST